MTALCAAILGFIDVCREYIKLREVIFAVLIVGIAFALGFGIHTAIADSQNEEVERYYKAFKPASPAEFVYGASTDIGAAMMAGTIKTDDPVTTEHAAGEYMKLKINKEHYTMHTRIVTHTDSEGHTYTEIETYYTWDVVNSEIMTATTYNFEGLSGNVSELPAPRRQINIDYEGGNVWSDDRWVVYGVDKDFDATLYCKLKDDVITAPVELYTGLTVAKVVAMKERTAEVAPTVFSVFWIILTIVAVVVFFIHENTWLDGGKLFVLRIKGGLKK